MNFSELLKTLKVDSAKVLREGFTVDLCGGSLLVTYKSNQWHFKIINSGSGPSMDNQIKLSRADANALAAILLAEKSKY